MSNPRGGFRFRIPWLGAAPLPRSGTNQNQTSRTEKNSNTTPVTSPITPPGTGSAVVGTLATASPSDTGSIPRSPPPSPPPTSRVLMSPRTVFSPRLVPRLATTSQLQSSPPSSLPASLPSSPTRDAPPPLLSNDRKVASPKRETKLEDSPRTRFPPPPEAPSENVNQSQTGTTPRPVGMNVGPRALPSEKIVLENSVIVPPKSRPEVENRPKDQADGDDEKQKKRKEEKSKADTKPDESRGRSRRATHSYTFHGKPPIKTRPPPPPPPPPPPRVPPPRVPPPPPPPSLQKSIKEDVSKLIHELTATKKYQIAEALVDMVTLAGENKGAMMRLGSEASSKEKSIHIQREYKTNPNASFDDEFMDNKEKFNQVQEEEVEAFINSNVQEVNNSMVVDSSVSEKNPGVHMTISLSDIEEELQSPETLPETRRDEFSPTPSQKLTYNQPIVKRRCLRGLFMESSDSDLDDPTKERRHGCRYMRCGEKSKDKGKGISTS